MGRGLALEPLVKLEDPRGVGAPRIEGADGLEDGGWAAARDEIGYRPRGRILEMQGRGDGPANAFAGQAVLLAEPQGPDEAVGRGELSRQVPADPLDSVAELAVGKAPREARRRAPGAARGPRPGRPRWPRPTRPWRAARPQRSQDRRRASQMKRNPARAPR